MRFSKTDVCLTALQFFEKTPSKAQIRDLMKKAKCSERTVWIAWSRITKGEDLLAVTIRENKELRSELHFLYKLMNTKFIPLSGKEFDTREREFIRMLDERYEKKNE